MDATQAKAKLILAIAKRGIFDPAEQEATIQKILESAPQSALDKMGDMNDMEKALNLVNSYFATSGGEQAAVDPTKHTSKASTKPTVASMTAEDQSAIKMMFDSKAVETGKRAAQTRVINQLTDKPVLAAIHVSGAKLTPSRTESFESKFAEYEKALCEDPENRKKFEAMKAAVEKGEQVEVYLNANAKEKVIGWTIETLDENMNPTTKQLTKESAKSFLILDVQGIIQTRGENTLGLRIRWSTSSKSKSASNNESDGASKGVTSVTVLNRKAIKDNPGLSVCTCSKLSTAGVEAINESYSARSDMFFEIYTGKTDSKGQKAKRKVRLAGKTKAYRVERDEQYLNTFGAAERKKGEGEMTKKELQKLADARVSAMYALANDEGNNDDAIRAASAALKRFQRQPNVEAFN